MSIVPGRDVPEVPQAWVDAVNDALMLLRGTDPQALKMANVEKRKAKLGW